MKTKAGSPATPVSMPEGGIESGARQSDEEVIASFMEPNPEPHITPDGARSKSGWWVRNVNIGAGKLGPWVPAFDAWNPHYALGILNWVEARLTGDGTMGNPGSWREYINTLRELCERERNMREPQGNAFTLKELIHATAEQKIKALAAVLRNKEAEI